MPDSNSSDDTPANDAPGNAAPEEDAATDTGSEAGAPLQPHGDPLLASAQGRNDGDDGTRHGFGATAESATQAEAETAGPSAEGGS